MNDKAVRYMGRQLCRTLVYDMTLVRNIPPLSTGTTVSVIVTHKAGMTSTREK